MILSPSSLDLISLLAMMNEASYDPPMDQVALQLPDGSTSSRVTDLMKGPAAASQHVLAPERPPVPYDIVGLEPLEGVEAASILEQAEEVKYRPRVDTNAVQTMRARHHQIARLLAMGKTPAAIGRIMDCSYVTVINLEKSPAFQALLMEYMNMLDGEAIETVTRMRLLGNLTIDEMTERLVNPGKAKEIKTSDLVEIAKLTMDRSGLGPTTNTKVSLNGALSPADIRAFKTAAPPSGSRVFEASIDPGDSASFRIDSDGEEISQGDDGGAEAGTQLRAPDREMASTGDLIADIVLAVDRMGR